MNSPGSSPREPVRAEPQPEGKAHPGGQGPGLTALVICASAVFPASVLADPRDAEIQEMKAMMQEMSKTIRHLQGEVDDLKKQKAAARVAVPNAKPISATAAPVNRSTDQKSILDPLPPAAPPPPKGYLEIPGTDVIFKIGGSARLDVIYDSGRNGNPNEFLPATFLLPSESGFHDNPDRSQIHGKGSRLSLEVRRPGDDSHFRVYYENDFFGDSSANAMTYRLRHFYGEAWGVLAGHTFSNFMDIDVYPDVIDYEGPNGLVYVRQPQLRYTHPFLDRRAQFALAAEQATPQIDTDDSGRGTDSEIHHRLPDFTAHLRYDDEKWGHVQAAGIFRQLSYENELRRDEVNGWGVSVSAQFKVFERDTVQLQATYGEGIARYVQDPSGLNLDAGLDAEGSLKAIPVFAISTGYTHHWSERWRSTVSYSFVRVDPEFSNGPLAFERSHYVAANLIYQSSSAVSMGLEYLYGIKQVADGEDTDGHRLNFVIKYDINK